VELPDLPLRTASTTTRYSRRAALRPHCQTVPYRFRVSTVSSLGDGQQQAFRCRRPFPLERPGWKRCVPASRWRSNSIDVWREKPRGGGKPRIPFPRSGHRPEPCLGPAAPPSSRRREAAQVLLLNEVAQTWRPGSMPIARARHAPMVPCASAQIAAGRPSVPSRRSGSRKKSAIIASHFVPSRDSPPSTTPQFKLNATALILVFKPAPCYSSLTLHRRSAGASGLQFCERSFPGLLPVDDSVPSRHSALPPSLFPYCGCRPHS